MFNIKHCWGEDYFACASLYSVQKLLHKKGAIPLISNLASLLIITEPPVNLLPVSIWRFGSNFTSLYLANGLVTGLLNYTALRGKCPDKEFFSAFGLKTGKYGPEKTPYWDTFYTVQIATTNCHKITFLLGYTVLGIAFYTTAIREWKHDVDKSNFISTRSQNSFCMNVQSFSFESNVRNHVDSLVCWFISVNLVLFLDNSEIARWKYVGYIWCFTFWSDL